MFLFVRKGCSCAIFYSARKRTCRLGSFTRQPRSRKMIIHSQIDSSHLAGNLLGDPSERDLFVYLPPGYDESDRQYPMAYLLHAYGDTAAQVVTPDTDGLRWWPPIEDVLDPVFGRMGAADDRGHSRRQVALRLRPMGRLAGDRQLRAVRPARRGRLRRRSVIARSHSPEAEAYSGFRQAGSAPGTSRRAIPTSSAPWRSSRPTRSST